MALLNTGRGQRGRAAWHSIANKSSVLTMHQKKKLSANR